MSPKKPKLVTEEELKGILGKIFDEYDTDKNGTMSYKEFTKMVNGLSERKFDIKNRYSEEEIKNLDIVPNPNNGIFSLDIKQEIYKGEIRISDIIGRQISSQSTILGENIVELPNLLHGTYLLQIIEDGKVITTKKMIVE